MNTTLTAVEAPETVLLPKGSPETELSAERPRVKVPTPMPTYR